MKILDRNFASGFISGFGIAGLFAVISVLIMNPEQLLHWLLHADSSEQKVERALSKPEELVVSLEKQLHSLRGAALLQNRNAQERESILINEKKRLEADLKSANTENLNTKAKLKEKELEIIKFRKITTIYRPASKDSILVSDLAPSELGETAVWFEYADKVAKKAFQIKMELENVGVSVEMKSTHVINRRFMPNIIYYKEESDLGLALKFLEFLSKHGYTEVKKKKAYVEINGKKFAFGIWN